MSETVDALLCDLLGWLAQGAQPYGDVMDAWRTSCPRLTVWEDALDAGLIARPYAALGPMRVALTPAGRKLLAEAAR